MPTNPYEQAYKSGTLYASSNGAVGASAEQVEPTAQACSEMLVQADPDNTDDVFLGNATSQPIQLGPGATVTIPVADVDMVYAKAASGSQTVNYLARS